MKTLIHINLKIILLLILGLIMAEKALAQKTYLAIYRSDSVEESITFPPGTPFELTDEDGKTLVTDAYEAGIYRIDNPSTLVVRPTWKKSVDRFELNEGKIIINPAAVFKKRKKSKSKYSSHGVTVEKTLYDSEKFNGQKNVKLEFSNGIVFTYTDGEVEATLNGKQLRINNEYIIYSQLGVAKLSFNPDNGVVYWVFDANDK